jgi:neutral amino acid transport system ATP-binding protein
VTETPAESAAALAQRPEPRSDGPILEIDGVFKHFGGIRAVNGAGFEVPRGSITALIGPNGAGKTTLFNIVTGFYRPDAGAIRYEGRSIFGARPYRIARLGMVRTFQITKALAAMPVIDNMMLAAPAQPGESLVGLLARRRAGRRREAEVEQRARELLATFNLDAKRDEYAGTLSGGQRKLLELARALMTEPRMVLLDEPMAGINPTLGRRLLEHMHDLREDQGVSFLFVEHDMEVVMNHSDEVVVMANGETVMKGKPEEVRSDQRVIDAYLGGGGEPVAPPPDVPEPTGEHVTELDGEQERGR